MSGNQCRALSVDHGLAGSADLMDAATSIAAFLGMAHSVVAVEQRSASETDLRIARLEALETSAEPDEVILTGHTRDDLAETVLGNVLRGTGTSGLAGIPQTRGQYSRPLLDIPRADTRAVAAELGLPFSDDPQNDDVAIRRNRLRTETIPSLSKAFNPALPDALARLGVAAGADDELLESRAAQVPVLTSVEGVRIPAASVQTLPPAVATRVVRRALRMLLGDSPGSADDIAAVLAAAYGERHTIGGGIDVMREGPHVVLINRVPVVPEPIVLESGSSADWGEWAFTVSEDPMSIGRFGTVVPKGDSVIVRAPRPGDRIDLARGTKSVVRALAEADVPQRLRSRWPLVESGGRIVWIAGVRAAPVADEQQVTVRAIRRRS